MSARTIRLMRSAETEATAQMWQDSQRKAYTWFTEKQRRPFDEALAYFRDSICQRCEVWIALEGERIVGVLALEDDFLDHLYVTVGSWQLGIGSELLAHAKAVRADGLSLVTLQRNRRARRFYEARGFVTRKFGVSPAPENEPDVYYRWEPQGARGASPRHKPDT